MSASCQYLIFSFNFSFRSVTPKNILLTPESVGSLLFEKTYFTSRDWYMAALAFLTVLCCVESHQCLVTHSLISSLAGEQMWVMFDTDAVINFDPSLKETCAQPYAFFLFEEKLVKPTERYHLDTQVYMCGQYSFYTVYTIQTRSVV